ncbi:hypothetical protein EYF80_051433 [Liparis tanakae]|uniref:Uncharacterized protein n=1 Tax=Liparis tanakae TaxID=230148 RepID=A0A4Z2FDD6_9TELE|nr:hypothetical protein EYF80_051433 [Liparis tanakae]
MTRRRRRRRLTQAERLGYPGAVAALLAASLPALEATDRLPDREAADRRLAAVATATGRGEAGGAGAALDLSEGDLQTGRRVTEATGRRRSGALRRRSLSLGGRSLPVAAWEPLWLGGPWWFGGLWDPVRSSGSPPSVSTGRVQSPNGSWCVLRKEKSSRWSQTARGKNIPLDRRPLQVFITCVLRVLRKRSTGRVKRRDGLGAGPRCVVGLELGGGAHEPARLGGGACEPARLRGGACESKGGSGRVRGRGGASALPGPGGGAALRTLLHHGVELALSAERAFSCSTGTIRSYGSRGRHANSERRSPGSAAVLQAGPGHGSVAAPDGGVAVAAPRRSRQRRRLQALRGALAGRRAPGRPHGAAAAAAAACYVSRKPFLKQSVTSRVPARPGPALASGGGAQLQLLTLLGVGPSPSPVRDGLQRGAALRVGGQVLRDAGAGGEGGVGGVSFAVEVVDAAGGPGTTWQLVKLTVSALRREGPRGPGPSGDPTTEEGPGGLGGVVDGGLEVWVV